MFRSLRLYTNQNIRLEEIILNLIDFGYKRSDMISLPGDFAVRGGVVDIYPSSFQTPVRLEFIEDKICLIKSYDPVTAKSIDRHNMVIILPIRQSLQLRLKREKINYGERLPIDNFVDVKRGDYIVHIEHGIGIYKGIEKVKEDSKFIDYIVIEYAGGDKLYTPVSDIYLVQRYIGFTRKLPRLHKLGGKLWHQAKERTKKAVFSLAKDLLEMQARRSYLKGFAFTKDTDWQKVLEENFPYDETPDQLRATIEAKKDMEVPHPMDRLLCGDVGYGKTEVALRTAFKAVMDNKQVAVLVPTTILAEQHFITFSQRLQEFPVNIQMLSRFKSQSQQKVIIAGLKTGAVDMVIGTHRLLSPDIQFKDLGLVIIDEEQRFGVKHKEKLKHLRLIVDVLTLTATPIPRTLYMSLMGAKDMSVINTPPSNRLPVETIVTNYDDNIVKKTISHELHRHGQVYFVHNRIKSIERVGQHLRQLFPKATIDIGHGQMKPHELEEVMVHFIKGNTEILVSTAIVQSGIDIPNANTIIVNHAENFGLADLYQLRGRVGRYKRKAYAYFFVPKEDLLTSESKKRLAAIEEHTALGSGFKIAMEDLEIRGAGNLLGAEQHGFIELVGFDFYCRLLHNAIDVLKHDLNDLHKP